MEVVSINSNFLFHIFRKIFIHFLTGLLIAGAGPKSTEKQSCLQWSPDTGTWEEHLTLDVGRNGHFSWTPDSDHGTYLMGGKTTTHIKPDGSQEPGFPLKYETK